MNNEKITYAYLETTNYCNLACNWPIKTHAIRKVETIVK